MQRNAIRIRRLTHGATPFHIDMAGIR